MSKNKRTLDAPMLRIILSISLVLIIALVVVGFTFAHQWLTSYAVDIGKKNIDAESSETNTQALTVTEKELAENADVREIANKLRLDDNHPEFTVREILGRIAKQNDIDITISSDTAGGAANSSTAAPSGAAAPAPDTTGAAPQTTPKSSSKTFKLSLTLKPSRSESFTKSTYKDFLQFLRDLEQSLPKTKVNGVEITSGGGSEGGGASGGISVSALNVEIYIK